MATVRRGQGGEEILDEVANVVSRITGVQLGDRQRTMVQSRLSKRIMQLGLQGLEDYADYYRLHKEDESNALVSLLTTHHTYFFRESSHFEYLVDGALPALVANVRKRGERTLRVWSAACSKGHESYTLAMLLSVHLPRIAPDLTFEIFGTDVDPESIATARAGVYPYKEIKEIPADYLRDHWARGTGAIDQWAKVKSKVRKHCSFEPANLLDLSSMASKRDFDIIFCRNVFIYFTPAQVKTVAEDLLRKLRPDGLLFIGISESLSGMQLPLSAVGPSIYQKTRPDAATVPQLVSQPARAAVPALVRVLVVDDSTSIQAVLKQVLGKDRGFEVVGTAANGIEAAKLLRTLEVDAMTLDIHMPGQGGVDYLKANFSRAHPPVVMVSSVDREEADLAHKCLTIGASDYVEKPTLANMGERGEELRNKIRAALRHRQHRGLRPPLQLFVEDGVVIAAFDETMQQGACIALKASELTSARLDQCLADIVRAVGHRPAGALQWKAVGIGQSLATASSHFDSRKIPVNSVPWSRGPLEALYDPSSGRLRVAKAQVAAEGGPSSRAKESRRTRVLIVDDSTTIQKLLAKILGSDPSIEVVGVSGRPVEVAGLVEELAPDVITLDIHMPEMDGVALLKKLMARRPVRAVMISSLGLEDGPLVLAALEAGAVDYIQKPSAHRLDAEAPVIVERVKVAGRARLIPAKCSLRSMATETIDKTKLVAIGSSTGGTEALRSVLTAMPAEIPPILIVQHIPAGFSKAFAERLDSLCSFKVKEAVDGDPVVPNRALIAPGGKHMRVVRRGDLFSVVIEETEPVNRHRPSVDVLFDSVAAQVGAHSVGIILTGMGTDGAQGLLRMRDAGAVTLGQDEASCIVYGMPREAAKIGGVQHVVPLDQVAETVVRLLRVKAVSRVS